ncbi:MAG: MATE family efflux transporter [Xanthomonadales bacterium]|nr:Multidrug resistance protein MdtK [Xanthomonadales bacterium]MCC6593887.1 MATE family efflux transporter [Xanthomonadales bacterium]
MTTSYRQHYAETLRLAAPVAVAQLSAMGMNVADSVIAGRLGAAALGGVAVGAAIYSFSLLLTIGTIGALTPTVAQLFGARRFDEIAPRARQAWWLVLALGLLVMMVCFNARHLLLLIGIDSVLYPHARDFLRGVGWGGPGLAALFMLRGYADGLGRTKPGMVVSALGLVALVPLAIWMALGGAGMPPLGTFGLGLATALVLWLEAISLALYLHRAHWFRRFGSILEFPRPDPQALRALLGIGLPMAFSWQMEGGLFIVVALLMGRIGGDWAAAHQIAINVASVAFMIPLGLAQAVSVRVGHARGAEDKLGVRRAGLAGLGIAFATQLASAAIMLLFAARITRLYAPDAPQLVPLAVQLLFLAGIFQLSDGIQVVAAGALRGLKDTRFPMLITAFAYWGAGFPLAWTLGFGLSWGGPGLWVGFIAGLTVAAIGMNWRFAVMLRRS